MKAVFIANCSVVHTGKRCVNFLSVWLKINAAVIYSIIKKSKIYNLSTKIVYMIVIW